MSTETTVYTADTVITLNPNRREATAVAVRDARVLSVGSLDELGDMADSIDRRFDEKVLMPGFVEAHSHAFGGLLWSHPYVGYFDRQSPDGTHRPGCRSVTELVERLREAERELGDPDEPLLAWGIEPIYLEAETVDAEILDQVSETRPVFVYHANAHVASVNSSLLHEENIASRTDVEGVETDSDGEPTGLLQEKEAIALAGGAYERMNPGNITEQAIENYGKVARNVGVTTLGEVGGPRLHNRETVDRWQRIVNDPDFPARVALAYSPSLANDDRSHEAIAEHLDELAAESSTKLRLGTAKFFTDGSIQGGTARLRWPHYHEDGSNGMWLTAPDELTDVLRPYHEQGLTIFCHCNGDEASEAFIDAVEELQRQSPRWDHRHAIQHCQMATADQYRRMKELGICANIFSNHVYYYGDHHYETFIGPDRAERMDACATAKRHDVPFTLHSDFPVTPMSQLHTAWCAATRTTASGRTLGATERISVREALEAVTVGAAFQLGMDDEIGTIETGKRADFAVLEKNPLEVEPADLADVRVWGTVLGGTPFPAGHEG